MSMFVRWELLELFDQERIIDEESKIYEYTLKTTKDSHFKLHIATFDEYVAIMLQDPGLGVWTFDVDINGVTRIAVEKEFSEDYLNGQELTFLSFFQHENPNSALRVLVKPTVSLQYSIARTDQCI